MLSTVFTKILTPSISYMSTFEKKKCTKISCPLKVNFQYIHYLYFQDQL